MSCLDPLHPPLCRCDPISKISEIANVVLREFSGKISYSYAGGVNYHVLYLKREEREYVKHRFNMAVPEFYNLPPEEALEVVRGWLHVVS